MRRLQPGLDIEALKNQWDNSNAPADHVLNTRRRSKHETRMVCVHGRSHIDHTLHGHPFTTGLDVAKEGKVKSAVWGDQAGWNESLHCKPATHLKGTYSLGQISGGCSACATIFFSFLLFHGVRIWFHSGVFQPQSSYQALWIEIKRSLEQVPDLPSENSQI